MRLINYRVIYSIVSSKSVKVVNNLADPNT